MLLFDKINIAAILTGHWETLKYYDTNKRSWLDAILFYLVPAAATGTLFWAGVTLGDGAISVLTNAFAILAGLLFNLLVILHGLATDSARQRTASIRELTKQIYSNIAYAIVVSLVALVPLTIAANYPKENKDLLGHVVASGVAIYLTLHFGLTIAMILKRMHALLARDFAQK